MPALSIVVPAFNEADRLTQGMRRLEEAVDRGALDPASTEFLVVDDGSTDTTAATAAALLEGFPHHRVIRQHQNRGKGSAVRAGVAAATAPRIAFMDADMAIHPLQLPALLAPLEHADLAIGSRATDGRAVTYATRRRTWQGRAFNLAVNTLTGVGLRDTQCGFKAFRAPVARLLFACTVIDRFAFDMELLRAARALGLRIAEVTVGWSDVPDSRIRPWRDPASMLLDLLASRSGWRTPPPLPALEVVDADPATVAAAIGDPTVPLLRWGEGGTLVLCVLGPDDRPALAGRLADRWGDGSGGGSGGSVPLPTVRQLTVPVARLRELAPLSLVWGAAPAVGTMDACPAPGTSPPPTDPRR